MTDTDLVARLPKRRTGQAFAYLSIVRRQSPDDSTWFDVARAYDAGLQSAVLNRSAARRALNDAALAAMERGK